MDKKTLKNELKQAGKETRDILAGKQPGHSTREFLEERLKQDGPTAVVDKNMKTHENDPFFIKKAAEASAFLKKHGLPPGFGKNRIA